MKYEESSQIIARIEQGLLDIFEKPDFNFIEIPSIQLTENKKGIITAMPIIKLVRNPK